MQRRSHAFEIIYDGSGKVLDHSELFFSDLPGAGSREMSAHLAEQMGELRSLWEASRDLLDSVCEWMKHPKFSRKLNLFGEPIGIEFSTPVPGTAIVSIKQRERVAILSLLIAHERTDEQPPGLSPDWHADSAFMMHIQELLPESPLMQHRARLLIRLTRRPLVVSVVTQPIEPNSDAPARTAQRMVAYAFFRQMGVLE